MAAASPFILSTSSTSVVAKEALETGMQTSAPRNRVVFEFTLVKSQAKSYLQQTVLKSRPSPTQGQD